MTFGKMTIDIKAIGKMAFDKKQKTNYYKYEHQNATLYRYFLMSFYRIVI
jgi:hypothetical protein